MIDLDRHLSSDLYYYDEAFADQCVLWFPTHLRHTIGPRAGQPFVLSPWQEFDIIRPLFGIKHKSDGTRRYRVVWIEIPKKNGKTTFVAGVMVMATVALGESGAEVYSLACDRNQARICFNEASRMVLSSPTLENEFVIYRNHLLAPGGYDEETGLYRGDSIYKPLTGEIGSNDGYNAFAVGIDEVHRQRNWELYRVMQYSMSARNEPFFFMMTTAGVWDPESLYLSLHERAMKIRSGEEKNDSWLVCWYGADKDDDWESEEVWKKANPELGKAKTIKGIREDYATAKTDPREVNNFKRLHLNIITSQTTAAIDMADWANCSGEIDRSALFGKRCYGGLDLSTTTDLTALALVFPPEDEEDKWKVLCDFWLPRDRILKLQEMDGVPYQEWVHDGWITATPGNVIDYRHIRERINELAETYELVECAFDPFNATQISLELIDDGIEMIEFRQYFKYMNEPTRELLKLIIQGKLSHGDNPVLTEMASSLQIRDNMDGYIRPDKLASTKKIDGIVATIMGLGRAILNEGDFGPSAYAEKGGLFL